MSDRPHDQSLGLCTDLPPDSLGNRAFDLRNTLPASPISERARDGKTLIGHYAQASTGRALAIDTAPGRTDGRDLLIATRTTDPGGAPGHALLTSVTGLADFLPLDDAPLAAPVLGTDPGPFAFGSFGSETLADLVALWVI